jgi:hypothetical protein
MNINPGMVIPLGSKKLGDLSRDTPEINELFTAILHAVQVVGAHKLIAVFLLIMLFYSDSMVSGGRYAVRPGAACELYKRLQKVYDFKTKVLTAMKPRHERVSGPGSHSNSHNPTDHEDLSVVDELSVCLFVEFQESVDIQEALRRNNLLETENINNASQFLAPNPPPLP